MRTLLILTGLLASTSLSALGQMPAFAPTASRMEPKVGKPGTVLTITGVALGKTRVDEVYLTDHRFDMKVKVLEQTDTSLKIRIPPFTKAGRHQLLFLTAGQTPAYLEQPVFVVIDVEEDVAKTDAAKPSAAPAADHQN